ncbi:Glycine betaine transporter OpuD [Candidatus Syntrophocurvum alkaliphilum]|uniref:Glycine betaine transporter OpuD n=1 Tax=Candidatus Syntrophocurvum alkaliphilum TaxID=2293317 RepID=A0A6I6DCL8_9FIRM|nr:BCCT family transporter [Candidatus Syntrophocurvum alkaliphilum]QGU00405.1 Glycine betaine transporter OpuD [Candidatus Syntrophocurvum alkaliphilum]
MEQEQKGLTLFSDAIKTPVFIISIILAVTFVAIGIMLPEAFESFIDGAFDWMVTNLGWAFILGGSAFLFLIIFLILSPLGEIKLGRDDEEPAYSNKAWFAMLFSAGMGIGLLFWGVSEPINHYMWPAYGEANTAESLHMAMQYSFFHWGLHPWAIYAVVAGALAYFSYRKGLPMLLSSTLEPILGRDGINGGWGYAVNIIGVLATLFGISTSLGMGVMQIGGGMETLFGIQNNPALWLTIIVVVTTLAIVSTTTGINRGIKWLSQINITIAGTLMLLVFVVGPTLFIVNLFTHSFGEYLQNLLSMSFGLDAAGAGTEGWYDAWTIFYWAWWIAWAPFVGAFIARVSRGRTIRSFAIGVMLVPTVISMIWFSVFGGAALFMEHFGAGGIADIVATDEALGFFAMLANFPLSSLLVVVAMISVAIFFVTSSDSGTYVLGMLTSEGNPTPPMGLRITWGVLEGAFAAVLLLAGGLAALQTASLLGGFPFMIIMLLMIYCLFKALYGELKEGSLPVERARVQAALDDLREERKQ